MHMQLKGIEAGAASRHSNFVQMQTTFLLSADETHSTACENTRWEVPLAHSTLFPFAEFFSLHTPACNYSL
jgi:hypothetical protein